MTHLESITVRATVALINKYEYKIVYLKTILTFQTSKVTQNILSVFYTLAMRGRFARPTNNAKVHSARKTVLASDWFNSNTAVH